MNSQVQVIAELLQELHILQAKQDPDKSTIQSAESATLRRFRELCHILPALLESVDFETPLEHEWRVNLMTVLDLAAQSTIREPQMTNVLSEISPMQNGTDGGPFLPQLKVVQTQSSHLLPIQLRMQSSPQNPYLLWSSVWPVPMEPR